MALKQGVAIYATHTSLDNILAAMNGFLAKRLSLERCRPLIPAKGSLFKLEVTVGHSEQLKQALFEVGAGRQGSYSHCAFSFQGVGEFLPQQGANPYIGTIGKSQKENEEKLSFLVKEEHLSLAVDALLRKHPYEVPAYDIFPLFNRSEEAGSGLVGELKTPLSEEELLKQISRWSDVKQVIHSKMSGRTISRIAICSGYRREHARKG